MDDIGTQFLFAEGLLIKLGVVKVLIYHGIMVVYRGQKILDEDEFPV